MFNDFKFFQHIFNVVFYLFYLFLFETYFKCGFAVIYREESLFVMIGSVVVWCGGFRSVIRSHPATSVTKAPCDKRITENRLFLLERLI